MRIAIIYNSFDWCEQQIANFLYKKGNTVYQEHVNTINDKSFKGFDLVLNRVMPSYAARDPYFSMIKFMNSLMSISKETDLINSYEAASVDYSKYYAANLMEYYKIPTPKTYLLTEPIMDDIDRIIDKLNYPVIIKPTLSGRSRGVVKCIDSLEVDAAFNHVKADHTVIQEFTKSTEQVDYRVCVCNDEVVFTVTRSLIDGWLGCISKGSLMSHPDDVPEEVTTLAINVTKCIRAAINGVDIIMSKDGPVVIENNPTPNFSPKYISLLGFNPIKRIMRTILDSKTITPEQCDSEIFTAYFDGSASPNPGDMKVGGYIKDKFKTLVKFSKIKGHGTNNEAEYLALIELLNHLVYYNIKKVKIFGDAKLIIDQVNGDCKNNKLNLQRLALRAHVLLKQVPDWELTWIKRSKNKRADALSKQ
jgi:glutathione synthase/RimK-type ligase-like ATP-grasp enzyme/ribonuclease HI